MIRHGQSKTLLQGIFACVKSAEVELHGRQPAVTIHSLLRRQPGKSYISIPGVSRTAITPQTFVYLAHAPQNNGASSVIVCKFRQHGFKAFKGGTRFLPGGIENHQQLLPRFPTRISIPCLTQITLKQPFGKGPITQRNCGAGCGKVIAHHALVFASTQKASKNQTQAQG